MEPLKVYGDSHLFRFPAPMKNRYQEEVRFLFHPQTGKHSQKENNDLRRASVCSESLVCSGDQDTQDHPHRSPSSGLPLWQILILTRNEPCYLRVYCSPKQVSWTLPCRKGTGRIWRGSDGLQRYSSNLNPPVKVSGKGLKERVYPGEDILGEAGSRGRS